MAVSTPKPRVNQRELSRALNLSVATVSKALNGHPDISASTQARVLEVASRLGYRMPPRANSASKRHRRQGQGAETTRFVGVIVYDNAMNPKVDLTAQGYFTGLSEFAATRNVSLVVHRFGGDSDQILDPSVQPAAMRDGLLSGLILMHRFDPEVVRKISTQHPCVSLTHYVPQARLDHIDVDHAGAMDAMVGQLAEAGHRQIGFLGRNPRFAYTMTRYGSFCQAMARHGLVLRPHDCLSVVELADADTQAQHALNSLRSQDPVTAWVCDSDHVGYQLIKRLDAQGVRVPDDVSVTGFDELDLAPGAPQLATARVPFAEMGVAALERLLERIERPTLPPRQTLLHCQAVPGQTIAPPKVVASGVA